MPESSFAALPIGSCFDAAVFLSMNLWRWMRGPGLQAKARCKALHVLLFIVPAYSRQSPFAWKFCENGSFITIIVSCRHEDLRTCFVGWCGGARRLPNHDPMPPLKKRANLRACRSQLPACLFGSRLTSIWFGRSISDMSGKHHSSWTSQTWLKAIALLS